MLRALLLILTVAAAGTVHADSGLTPLSTLLVDADVVVRARVDSVAAGAGPGDLLATLDVEHTFAGSSIGTIVVSGSTLDPSMHAFAEGERIIAFLGETPTGPGTHAGVDGLNGIVEIVPGSETGANGLVAAAIAGGSTFGLAGASPYLRLPNPAPRMLVAAVLLDLTETVGPADHADIVSKACDSTGFELAATKLWALERIGALDPVGGRACLESTLVRGVADLRAGKRTSDPEILAAIIAFGNIGDPTATTPAFDDMLDLSLKDASHDAKCFVPPAYLDEMVLAVGKMGDDGKVGKLFKASRKFPELGVGSSVVHALGLIGGRKAEQKLDKIAARHPEDLVRQQAATTLTRVRR